MEAVLKLAQILCGPEFMGNPPLLPQGRQCGQEAVLRQGLLLVSSEESLQPWIERLTGLTGLTGEGAGAPLPPLPPPLLNYIGHQVSL